MTYNSLQGIFITMIGFITWPPFCTIIFCNVELLIQPYKVLPVINKFFTLQSFFSFFYFHRTLFVGLRYPRNFYLKHSFSTDTCFSNNSSFLHGFLSNLHQHFSHVYSTSQYLNIRMYLRDTFTLYVNSLHNSDPLKSI